MTYITVTRHNAPLLFECLETISHDRGAGAGHPDYTIPAGFLERADKHEVTLAKLSPRERQLFCIGDADDIEEMCRRSVAMRSVTILLNAFLDDFEV